MIEAPLPGVRIAVCGTSGSGKTTLGAQLAKELNLPHLELDSIYHMPGWTPRPAEEFLALVDQKTIEASWVIDGNYSKVRQLIFDRADTIVWLDFPLPLILYRLTRRTFGRAIRRELLWGTNRESLWRHLFVPKDSLYWWVLTTYRRRRAQADEVFAKSEYADKKLIRLYSPRDVAAWMARIRAR